MSHTHKRLHILYATYNVTTLSQAQSINSRQRISILRKNGYLVQEHSINPSSLRQVARLIRIIPNIDILYIRVDGSGFLEYLTLLKWIKPRLKVVWELHGFPEENVKNTDPIELKITIKNILRYFYSLFCNLILTVSPLLTDYAYKKLPRTKIRYIPNFVSKIPTNGKEPATAIINLLRKSDSYIVAWAGNPSFRWHALDVIEKTARNLYKKDPHIIFAIVASAPSWHTFTWKKNIIFLPAIPHTELLQFLKITDLCLGLYHSMSHIPPYFSSLKILDYMAAGKPVIASGAAEQYLTHKKNGFILSNSPATIADTIFLLKNNPKLATRIGKNAQNTVRLHFSETVAQNLYAKFFKEILTD